MIMDVDRCNGGVTGRYTDLVDGIDYIACCI
jgi:hypothetical protein